MHPFLEALLCGSKLKRIEELEGIESSLRDELGDKNEELGNLRPMLEAWKIDYADLEHRLGIEVSLAKIKLIQALKTSIKIPDIKFETATNQRYSPWNDPAYQGISMRAIADLTYLTYSLEDWLEILNKVYGSVSKAQERWKKEVGDCDNWAEAIHYVTTNATLRAGLPHQSAIAIAWGQGHAHNLFVDSAGEYWIYEPQTNKLKGKLGELTGQYGTNRIYYIG